MTSKKLVYDTLDFHNHARAPRQLWTLMWDEIHYPQETRSILHDYPPDIIGAPGFLKEIPKTQGDPYALGEYTDEWGCRFINCQAGIIGEVKEPLITSEEWEDAGKMHMPTEWLNIDTGRINAFCKAHDDQFITCGCTPRPFEQLQFLRGTEQLFVDLMEQPAGFLSTLARMHAFYCELLEEWAKTDVDALNFMDDWGAQNNLLIPPRIWRQLFKPLYKDYIDIAHRHGKRAFMHSDGNTLAIYPDLIELGLDAFNSQIFCIGLEALEPFRGRITFWGEMDRQHLLPEGSVEDIEHAVRQVIDHLWQDGGCIAQCEFGPGAKPENVRACFESWDRFTSK